MKATARSKYIAVKQLLSEAIRAGEFTLEERLPGERALAERYGVSVLTARRAVSELADSGLVERRRREGTYITESGLRSIRTVTLTFVSLGVSGVVHPVAVGLFEIAARRAEQRGWEAEFLNLQGTTEDTVVRYLHRGSVAMVVGNEVRSDGLVARAMREAKGRMIAIGGQGLEQVGVPVVSGDDAEGMRVAMEHLMSAGHRRIAIMYPPHVMHTDFVVETWRSCYVGRPEAENIDRLMIPQSDPNLTATELPMYGTVRRYLASPQRDATAILCRGDLDAIAAIAAIHDAGLRVPQDISIVAYNGSYLSALYRPAITAIEHDLEAHIDLAFEVLDKATEGRFSGSPLLNLVRPRLVERQTVRRIESS